MASSSLVGKDTTIINNRVLTDFGIGDVVTLTFPNDISDMQVGKNGNAIYTFMYNGKQVDVELKVLLASGDDKFLNSLLITQEADFPAFVLLNGQFSKRTGDGLGNINSVTYSLLGGVFSHRIETKENVDGDKEQALAVYKLKFADAPRSI